MYEKRKNPSEVDETAEKLWNYLRLEQLLRPADVIIALGSSDESIPERAAALYKDGYGDLVLVSGGVGPNNECLSSGLWAEATEAEHFADIVLRRGVPVEKLLIEKESKNTGENLIKSYQLLKDRDLMPRSIILVHKPYMERRVFATASKQWPDRQTNIQITSWPVAYAEYAGLSSDIDKALTLNRMVGVLQRVCEYPKMGYQIEQDIPDDVWQAYLFLVDEGYDSRLLK